MKSSLLSAIPGISHGFGDRLEPVPAEHRALYDNYRPHWKQVHGTQIGEITRPNQECGEIDAMFSFIPGMLVTVMTADCVPILLARRDGRGVAAIHAGWRGTYARITTQVWNELARKGETPQDWVAAIGPAIGACCYEVGTDLLEKFQLEFPEYSVRGDDRPKPTLDLQRINALELRKIGIGEIEISSFCTSCSRHPRTGETAFFSYRRDSQGRNPENGRQWATLVGA
jgi:YfiH family protein